MRLKLQEEKNKKIINKLFNFCWIGIKIIQKLHDFLNKYNLNKKWNFALLCSRIDDKSHVCFFYLIEKYDCLFFKVSDARLIRKIKKKFIFD